MKANVFVVLAILAMFTCEVLTLTGRVTPILNAVRAFMR